MTILICSGSLFSDWEYTHEQHLLTDSTHHQIYAELSAFNTKICQEHMPGAGKLDWKPIFPDESHVRDANELLSSVLSEQQLAWADANSSLLLDLWQKASEHARFVLFYSSPEYELANYIRQPSFELSAVKGVIDAWIVRNRAMLSFFMKTKSTCLLIDVQSAMRNPGKLISTINKAFDTELVEPGDKDRQAFKQNVLYEYLAATFLRNNDFASELFDEIRSAATLLEDDMVLFDIQKRTELLIPDFLGEIDQREQLRNALAQKSDELTMTGLQLHQTQKELEFYYLKERDTAAFNEKYIEFMNQNPLIKLARLVRLNESS